MHSLKGRAREKRALARRFGQKTIDLFSELELTLPNRADYEIGIT